MEVFQVFLLLPLLVSAGFACNGNTLENFRIADCTGGKEEILKFSSDFNAKLKENCDIEPTGTVEIKETIKNCNVAYVLNKKSMPPIKITGKKALCSALQESKKHPEVKQVLNAMDVNSCPVEKGTLDVNKAIVNIRKQKDKLGAVNGDVEGEIKGNCTVGDGRDVPVCYKVFFTVKGSSSRPKMFG